MQKRNLSEIVKTIENWDKRIFLKYYGLGGKKLTQFFKIMSFFGREAIWSFLVYYYILIWFDPIIAANIGSAYLVGLVVIVLIKEVIQRPRPFQSLENVKPLELEPSSGSFPSWHAYNVASQAIVFSFLFSSYLLLILFLSLATLISFTRIQLGVHYPIDVILGYVIGIGGGIFTIFFLGRIATDFLIFIEMNLFISLPYRELNPLLIQNLLYLLIAVSIFVFLIFIVIYKNLLHYLEK